MEKGSWGKVLLCLMLCACAPNALAQAAQPPGGGVAVFELNNDMIVLSAPSSRLFLGWQKDVNALFRLGLDGVSTTFDLDRSLLLRSAALLAFSAASLVVNNAFSLTAHDLAHMEAARAIGASYVGLVRSDNGQQMSIGQFFLEAFNFTLEPGLYLYSAGNATLQQQAYVAGEGLDTNLLTADAVSRRMDEGQGHIMDLAPYLLNKLWGINYFLQTGPTSDASDYMELLARQGYGNVTRNNVLLLLAGSCLVSGGFLGLMRGTFGFLADGDPVVKPLGVSIGEVAVFWPEITTWLNPQEVSLQATVDAAWRDVFFYRVGIEAPVLGNTAVNPEVTVGAKARIQRLFLGAEVTTALTGFPFLETSAELVLGRFSAGIRGFYGQGNTVRERREYPLGPGLVGFITARI